MSLTNAEATGNLDMICMYEEDSISHEDKDSERGVTENEVSNTRNDKEGGKHKEVE